MNTEYTISRLMMTVGLDALHFYQFATYRANDILTIRNLGVAS